MSPRRPLLAILLASIAALALHSGSAAAAACPKGASCGSVSVPLDHAGTVLGTLSVHYARVPATSTRTGTLVFLAGGPGQSAIDGTTELAQLLQPLELHDDLVVVDLRGTGQSATVSCGEPVTAAQIAACATKLGAQRPFLSTAEAARDLDALRAQLGVDRLTLLGVSYGTDVAGTYARLFPQHTAALVLDSAVPVDGLDDLGLLPQQAFARVLDEICKPSHCDHTISAPASQLAKAIARLTPNPLRTPVVSGSGKVSTIHLTVQELYEALRLSDSDLITRLSLPAALTSLAKGDGAPLAHLFAGLGSGSGEDDINEGTFLATSCIEGALPWAPDSPTAGRAAALTAFGDANAPLFAPFSPATVLADSTAQACESWPPTPAPEAVPTAGPNVPVLVIAGRADLRTPLESARQIAAQYPDASVLSVPGVGHSVLTTEIDDCALTRVVAFLQGKRVAACPSALGGAAERYLPAQLDDLAPTGTAHRTSRTIRGVTLTLDNALSDALLRALSGATGRDLRIGALRGGYLRVTAHGIDLHGTSWFKGLRVSGTIDVEHGTGTLRISGASAAPGTLRLGGGHLRGEIGGRSVSEKDFVRLSS